MTSLPTHATFAEAYEHEVNRSPRRVPHDAAVVLADADEALWLGCESVHPLTWLPPNGETRFTLLN